jgi:metal-responsive CopG/Arc/MetJ family transcriptional regulator
MNAEQPARRGRGRPPKREKVRNQFQFTVLLPPDLVEALDRAAEQEGHVSRSEMIRRACAEYLARLESKERR